LLKVDALAALFVISGKVIAIAKPTPRELPSSDTYSQWVIATIKVFTVEKPRMQSRIKPGNIVSVVFPDPDNHEARWATSPRFTSGQEGIWFLHEAPSGKLISNAPGGRTYATPDASDFLNINSMSKVRHALERGH
jgi:hypothetical protein